MKIKWQQAPVKTQWGDEMMVASAAIDKDHTLSLYCERDQTPKVDAMFAQPPKREWVGLTEAEREEIENRPFSQNDWLWFYTYAIEAKLKEKNT